MLPQEDRGYMKKALEEVVNQIARVVQDRINILKRVLENG